MLSLRVAAFLALAAALLMVFVPKASQAEVEEIDRFEIAEDRPR